VLTLIIKGKEFFNEETQEFYTDEDEDVVVEFEHSLVSLSKWESIYKVPFLSANDKTPEGIFEYLQLMIVSKDVDPAILYKCSEEDLKRIQEYIDSSESATTFGEMPGRKGPGEVITSELIYYWMVAFNIPFECQYWHLNRLFALVRICNIKNQPPKKMSKHEIASRNRDLNAQRKAALNTKG